MSGLSGIALITCVINIVEGVVSPLRGGSGGALFGLLRSSSTGRHDRDCVVYQRGIEGRECGTIRLEEEQG